MVDENSVAGGQRHKPWEKEPNEYTTPPGNPQNPLSNGRKLTKPLPKKSKPQQQDPFEISSLAAFYVFLFTNLSAALYAPILDCDEVFNYWEPTHYLSRGFGLQTWEYSPEFAIRSWMYIVLHAVPGKLGSLLSSKSSFQFYFIRVGLAIVCTACQTRLFGVVSQIIGPRVASIFLIITASSSGMFYASVAYLPSSFAMYTTMMGMAAFLDTKGGLKTNQGIMWFGIGAVVGWPFSAALMFPLLADEIVFGALTERFSEMTFRIIDGVVRAVIIGPLDVVFNAFFYHKLIFAPWRIVSYNIFSGSSRGPEIFGIEPWHFYIRNLLLNFNAWFVLAMSAGPLLAFQILFRRSSTTRLPLLRSIVFATPFYLWLAIFSAQLHKEERFMYPAYPFLCLNAAITLHNMLFYLGQHGGVTGKIPAKIKTLFATGFVLLAVTVGTLRTLGTVSAFHAPLEIYKPLQSPVYADTEATVCLGKEWYRFPSSYFLPKNMRARFIKSAFDGLLPGQFSEARIGFGFFPTWLVPSGMNDQNIEDPAKYIDVKQCSFLVDSLFAGSEASALEPHYLNDRTWESVQCSSFLDSSHTHPLARILWVPDWDIIPTRYRRKWGRYCLMQRNPALR